MSLLPVHRRRVSTQNIYIDDIAIVQLYLAKHKGEVSDVSASDRSEYIAHGRLTTIQYRQSMRPR